jgi:hypothetical protein
MTNKTREYLQRIINVCYGKQFILELKSLTSYEDTMMGDSIKGIYALDALYARAKKKWNNLNPCFYIVFHNKGCMKDDMYVNPGVGAKRFNKFLKYVRDQKFYEHDYVISDTEHMVIIKIPKRFKHAYDMFLKNRYSEMYTQDDLEYLNFTSILKFDTGAVISLTYAVLTKNEEYGRMKVLKELENNFGVDTIPDDLTEYDIPWLIRNEVYHHEHMTDEEKELLKKLRL